MITEPFAEEEEGEQPPVQSGRKLEVPGLDQSKCSNRRNGMVRAYAANTN